MIDDQTRAMVREMYRRPAQPTEQHRGVHTRLCVICGRRFHVAARLMATHGPGVSCGCHNEPKGKA